MPDLFTWLMVAVAGFALAVTASRWAVQNAARFAYGTSIPPFLLGITFFALGTDVPEIANSIVASVSGHGDLNVGDSVGSVVTQITLMLGILPFVGGRLDVGPVRASIVPLLTAAGLAGGVFLVADGMLSRWDGLALVLAWGLAMIVAWRYAPPLSEATLPQPTRNKAQHAARAAGALLLVAAGATAAVRAMTELSTAAGIPEYLISFFGSSIGTSLPEMVVSIVALRQGQRDIAMGDIFGACLLDCTLSVGIGPLIAPTAVTAELAVRGALLGVGVTLLASFLIWSRGKHDRLSGTVLLLLYAAAYVIM